jgi:hypothetical protein
MATPKKVTKGITAFANKVLEQLNKSPEEKQVEQVNDKVEDFIYAIGSEIIVREDEIKNLEKELKRSERGVIEASKGLERTKMDILGKSFESYIDNITAAERTVVNAKKVQSDIKAKIEQSSKELLKYKELQEMFK